LSGRRNIRSGGYSRPDPMGGHRPQVYSSIHRGFIGGCLNWWEDRRGAPSGSTATVSLAAYQKAASVGGQHRWRCSSATPDPVWLRIPMDRLRPVQGEWRGPALQDPLGLARSPYRCRRAGAGRLPVHPILSGKPITATPSVWYRELSLPHTPHLPVLLNEPLGSQ
jgi:hypothetical protein